MISTVTSRLFFASLALILSPMIPNADAQGIIKGPVKGKDEEGVFSMEADKPNEMAIAEMEVVAERAWTGTTVKLDRIEVDDGFYQIYYRGPGGPRIAESVGDSFVNELNKAAKRNPAFYKKYLGFGPEAAESGAKESPKKPSEFQSESTIPKEKIDKGSPIKKIGLPSLTSADQQEQNALIQEQKRKWNSAQRNSSDATKKEFGAAVDRYNGEKPQPLTPLTGYMDSSPMPGVSPKVRESSPGVGTVPFSQSKKPVLGPDGKIREAREQTAIDDNEWLKQIKSPKADYSKPSPSSSSAEDEAAFPLTKSDEAKSKTSE